jgi:hypothetical protein
MKSQLCAAFLTVLIGSAAQAAFAQGGAPDQPSVTVRGQTYTPRSILARNMGTPEDQTTAFPPHKIIGNVYYVGTRTLTVSDYHTARAHPYQQHLRAECAHD